MEVRAAMGLVFKRKRRDPRTGKPTESKFYYIKYRGPDGRQHLERLKTRNYELAKRILKKKENEALERAHFPTPITLSEACGNYLYRVETAGQPIASWYRLVYRKHLIPYFDPSLMINEITPLMIEGYHSYRLSQGVARSTVSKEVGALRAALNLCIRDGFLIENPCRQVKPFRQPDPKDRFLTTEEQQELLKCCAPGLAPMVLFALDTGARRGELLSVTWVDVDLRLRQVTLRHTRSGKQRHIPMTGRLYSLLSDTYSSRKPKPDDRIFTNPNGKPVIDFRGSFASALKKASLGRTGVTFHTLRHTFASQLVIAGVPMRTVQKLMGHACITTTERYSHLHQDQLREAIRALDKARNIAESGAREDEWHERTATKSLVSTWYPMPFLRRR